MDIIQIAQALLLGLVEGVTEFLPISSTGHLIIFGDILGFTGPKSVVFDISIQLGAILAVCWKFRRRIIVVTETLRTNEDSQRFAFNILLAFLPAVIIGAMFHNVIQENFFTPMIVGIMMMFGGCLIVVIENNYKGEGITTVDDIDISTAFKIGLFQCIAMIPGVSRSGATIMGSLAMGVSRPAAAEFSFFLAIPTMFGATVFELFKNRHNLHADSLGLIAIGFIVAFCSALLVVTWLIDYISKHGFKPFAYYRIIVGSIIVMVICFQKQAGLR